MWVWYLGEPDDAGNFKCDIAIKKRNVREDESELKYSGRVHSIRIPPHRIILSGCLLSFSDYTAAHFRYIGKARLQSVGLGTFLQRLIRLKAPKALSTLYKC